MNKLMKALAIVLCVVALVGGSIAGTLAYLSMKTAPVNNTFTAGDVAITLTPTGITVKQMVPGQEIEANHTVTVAANSVNCYVFLKIEENIQAVTPVADPESGEPVAEETPLVFSNYLTYAKAEGWTLVPGETNVYYRTYTSSNADVVYDVFDGDIVANSACTKEQYNLLNNRSLGITLTAYAIQSLGFADAKTAWAEAEKLDNPKF